MCARQAQQAQLGTYWSHQLFGPIWTVAMSGFESYVSFAALPGSSMYAACRHACHSHMSDSVLHCNIALIPSACCNF